MGLEVCFYGVRGSSPISGSDYVKYGGNTASITIRTPQNTLIFIDAGTGIRIAEQQLDNPAKSVFLIISHTHADHIQGLGMTRLPFLDDHKLYDYKLKIIGTPGLTAGLSKFYDGESIWPVKFTSNTSIQPRMAGIDYEGIIEITDRSMNNGIFQLDDVSRLKYLLGNHPVNGGVLLYRFEIQVENSTKSVVYATDTEFDFLYNKQKNPNAEEFKVKYKEFIANADILIADAQYTKKDYFETFSGYGHSYHQQIIELANESNVKQLFLTHHHLYKDEFLDVVDVDIQEFVNSHNLNTIVSLAREGHKIILK